MAQTQVAESGVTATTPSGIEVYYQAKPKRLYRVRRPEQIDDVRRIDGVDWVEVPSVTTVLDVLSKGGLPWWGMRQGINAVIALVDRSLLRFTQTPEGVPQLAAPAGWIEEGKKPKDCDPATFTHYEYARLDNVEPLVTHQKLTVNHIRDDAGDRGTSVHKALENWINDRTMPVVDFYPAHEQGYVKALLAFLTDLGEVTKTQTEVMVGSVEHEFAGRYDLEAQLKKCSLVVNHETGERKTFPAGLYLLDAKTSSAIYTTQFIQLEAYEGARLECGYKPTKGRMVVRFDADGTYEVGLSKLGYDYWLAVLGCYNALRAAEAAQKAGDE